MYKWLILVFSLLGLFISPMVWCNTKNIKPQRVVSQFAGNIGLISSGVAWDHRHDPIDLNLLLGYAPASVAGNNIAAIALKTDYRIFKVQQPYTDKIKGYIGVGIFHYFSEQFNRHSFPDEYYSNTSYPWHLMPYLGLEWLPENPQHGPSLYIELGLLDAYVPTYFHNHDYIKLRDVVNLAVGLRFALPWFILK